MTPDMKTQISECEHRLANETRDQLIAEGYARAAVDAAIVARAAKAQKENEE